MANEYVLAAALKSTLSLTGETFADADIDLALEAASRDIDEACFRRFYADLDALQLRYYTPYSPRVLSIDDLATFTRLRTDPGGDGTYPNTWVRDTDFVLEPLNAGADQKPWTLIRIHPRGHFILDVNLLMIGLPGVFSGEPMPKAVEVQGKFGWPAVPPAIKAATGIRAHRLLRRAREAPFGVIAMGEGSQPGRLAREDPDVYQLIRQFIRMPPRTF